MIKRVLLGIAAIVASSALCLALSVMNRSMTHAVFTLYCYAVLASLLALICDRAFHEEWFWE